MTRVRRLAGYVPDTPMDDRCIACGRPIGTAKDDLGTPMEDLSKTLGRPIGTPKDDLGMIFGRARYAGGANAEMQKVSEWQSHGRYS